MWSVMQSTLGSLAEQIHVVTSHNTDKDILYRELSWYPMNW